MKSASFKFFTWSKLVPRYAPPCALVKTLQEHEKGLQQDQNKRKTKAKKKVQASCHFHWLGSGPIMDTASVGWAHTSMQKGQKIERKASGWRSFSLAGLRSITGKVTDGRRTHTYTNQKCLEAGETKISARPENQRLFVHLSRASHLQFNVKAFKSLKKKKTSLKLRAVATHARHQPEYSVTPIY